LAERPVRRRIGWLLAGLAVSAVAAGCSNSLYSSSYYSDGVQFTNDPSTLTILDPDVGGGSFHGDGYSLCGVVSRTELSDVAFTGRVVGYRQRLFVEPNDSSGPANRTIYEGIVMQAEEVLYGEMPEAGSRITLVEAPLEEGDEILRKRFPPDMTELLAGIEAMADPDSGPLYLVYASAAEEGTPAGDLNLYGASLVSQIGSNESIKLLQTGMSGTRSRCIGSEHGERGWVEQDYKLQDARAAGAYVSSLGEHRSDGTETYRLHSDINGITENSDLVFVGRVVDFIADLEVKDVTAANSVADQPDSEVQHVYSGIVFEADEVLLGEMPQADSRITLGSSSLQSTHDGKSRLLYLGQEVEVFSDGIARIGFGGSPQYLVYAISSEANSRAHELDLFWMNTRSGAVCVNANGTLSLGQAEPFNAVWAPDRSSEYAWHFPYSLQDARDAAELVKSGIENTTEQSTDYYDPDAPPIDSVRPDGRDFGQCHDSGDLGDNDLNSFNSSSDGTQFTNDPSTLTILDPTVDDMSIHADSLPWCGLVALTERSDVAFLGRVVGYRQRLFTVPEELGPDTSDSVNSRTVYEGIVMQAEEVLFGEMPEPGSRITLGAETLEESREYVRTRLLSDQRRLLPGIQAMADPESGPLYLIYAGASSQGTPAADHNLYWPRYVSEKYTSKINLTQWDSVFTTASCVGSEHGEREWVERNYTLQDGRVVAAYISGLRALQNSDYVADFERSTRHYDIDSITADSSVVFVGRVVDFIESLDVFRLSADLSSSEQTDSMVAHVYDGIVLEADEVLLGEMPEAGSRITLGVRSLQSTHNVKSSIFLFDQERVVFNDGIRSLDTDDSPQYLVYAFPSEVGSRGHELGLHWLNTRSGAVCVNADGSLGLGQASPFGRVWAANEAGRYDWLIPYDLQDARDAAELAKSDIADRAEELAGDAEQTPPIDRLRPSNDESTSECTVFGRVSDKYDVTIDDKPNFRNSNAEALRARP